MEKGPGANSCNICSDAGISCRNRLGFNQNLGLVMVRIVYFDFDREMGIGPKFGLFKLINECPVITSGEGIDENADKLRKYRLEVTNLDQKKLPA